MARGIYKFKANEEYHFGKLKTGHQVSFLRTPRRQVLTGSYLIDRGINDVKDYYEKNPSNYKVGENISICTKDENGLYKCLMTKTILEPLAPETLSDGKPSLDTHGNSSASERLDQVYKRQVDRLEKELEEANRLKNEYQQTVVKQAQELAELQVDYDNVVEKKDDLEKEFKEFKKEFGDIIKEARNPAPATLGDKLGDMVTQPEVMGMLTELGTGLAGFLKNKFNNVQTQPHGLNDAPPPHAEPEPVIKDDEAEVFNAD